MAETRKSNLKNSRNEYIITVKPSAIKDIMPIINLFHICKGRKMSFLFLDPINHECKQTEEINGDLVTLKEKFCLEDVCAYKEVHSIDESTLQVYVGNKIIPPESYQVYQNQIKFNQKINQQKVDFLFNFFKKVRFNMDHISYQKENKETITLEPLKLIEIQ